VLSERRKNVRRLTTDELNHIITYCERRIVKGLAQLEDYETFVLCQQALAERSRLHMSQATLEPSELFVTTSRAGKRSARA
jgi:hypothetical protein